ncbi:MAG: DEAD/DEAH box helicase [Corynebacterium sp.]|nr:DEAD/DEAH box helicase [Corynebacterium sp.]
MGTNDQAPVDPFAGLRGWQQQALRTYLEQQPSDFLAVATPGAGKTTFALRVATELLRRRTVERIIVVVPTEHLKTQWAQAAARVGVSLDDSFTNSSALNPAFAGVCVTYAQVALHPYKHYQLADTKRSLVILDEVHHGGDAKSWGDGIRTAYQDAERRLCLTGTPFRSDDAAIPFVRYVSDGLGHEVSRADFEYGYGPALADGVVRPVVFLAYSGEARWRDSAGDEYAARLGEPLTPEQTARAWHTALDPAGEWIRAVLAAAQTRLEQLRRTIPDAGGLVIATNKETARAYAKILRSVSRSPVTVVLSDEPQASEKIAEFSQSFDEWLVAVRMVSEGVDVPRLAVGVYATSASTPLFFAQAIGRFVRSRRAGESASIFLPSVPVLLELAAQLETTRDHVLGKPHREQGWDDAALEAANREATEPDATPAYQSLGADAELDSLIYDGSTYGTGAFRGSQEELDYLGLPGLLNPEQMRALLRRRQDEQVAKQQREAEEAAKKSGQVTSHQRAASAADLPALRKELNALVSLAAARSGTPHARIHSQVRAACGGPPTALASADQLRERIAYLRSW